MTRGLAYALQGPVMMLALGLLLAADQMGGPSFWRTWPVLLIIFGLFKLAQRANFGEGPGAPPPGSNSGQFSGTR